MDTNQTIALCLDHAGALCHVFQTEAVHLLQWDGTQWVTVAHRPIDMHNPTSIAQMKQSALALVATLGECRILVAKKFVGICYQMLSAQNLYLFELETVEGTLLRQCIEEVAALASRDQVVKTPVPTDLPGVYALDLIALQKKCPEISSKMALKSFFKEVPFQELWLKCKHLPPWIEGAGVSVRQMEPQEFLIVPTCL